MIPLARIAPIHCEPDLWCCLRSIGHLLAPNVLATATLAYVHGGDGLKRTTWLFLGIVVAIALPAILLVVTAISHPSRETIVAALALISAIPLSVLLIDGWAAHVKSLPDADVRGWHKAVEVYLEGVFAAVVVALVLEIPDVRHVVGVEVARVIGIDRATPEELRARYTKDQLEGMRTSTHLALLTRRPMQAEGDLLHNFVFPALEGVVRESLAWSRNLEAKQPPGNSGWYLDVRQSLSFTAHYPKPIPRRVALPVKNWCRPIPGLAPRDLYSVIAVQVNGRVIHGAKAVTNDSLLGGRYLFTSNDSVPGDSVLRIAVESRIAVPFDEPMNLNMSATTHGVIAELHYAGISDNVPGEPRLKLFSLNSFGDLEPEARKSYSRRWQYPGWLVAGQGWQIDWRPRIVTTNEVPQKPRRSPE